MEVQQIHPIDTLSDFATASTLNLGATILALIAFYAIRRCMTPKEEAIESLLINTRDSYTAPKSKFRSLIQ